MALDRNQKKVLGFLIFTAALLTVMLIRYLKQQPVEMESVLKLKR